MNPLFLNPWLIAGVALVFFVTFGGGYLRGVSSQAKETAVCETRLGQIEEAQHELEQKAEQQRLLSERITKDVSQSWSAALDYARSHPRTIRVRGKANECEAGTVRMPATSGSVAETPEESRLGTPGDVALTIEQINIRLNNAEQDAAQLAALIDWHARHK